MSGIEITPEMLDELKFKSRAATPGPWITYDMSFNDSNGDLRILAADGYGRKRSDPPIGDIFGPQTRNAAFIAAANPAVVLALVAEIERLNQRYDEQKLLATRMIEHAAEQKEAIDQLRQRSGNETDFGTKREVEE